MKQHNKLRRGSAIILSIAMFLSNLNVFAMDAVLCSTVPMQNETETIIIEETESSTAVEDTESIILDTNILETEATDLLETNIPVNSEIETTSTKEEDTITEFVSLDEFTDEVSALAESDNLEDDSKYATKRLLVLSDTSDFDNCGAENILSFDNLYVLQYTSEKNTKDAYNKLKADSSIISVDIDSVIQIQTSNTSLAETDTIKENTVPKSTNSREIVIAILDTGYDIEHYSNDRIVNTDFNTSNSGDISSIMDDNGHGTEMANIILNHATDAIKVMPLKIADSNGLTSSLKVYLAIKCAIEKNVDIINISMSSYKSSNSGLIETIIDEASAKGIFVVVAAGNANSDTVDYSPANVDSAITVSAVNNDYSKMNYSNYGDTVDFCAFGKVETQGIDGKTVEADGTSVSAAIVSLVIAQTKTLHNECSYDEIYALLKDNAIDLGDAGKDALFGNGILTVASISGLQNDEEFSQPELLTVDWKSLSDEELNDIISDADEIDQKKFLDNLTESELDELLARDILFNNTHVYAVFENGEESIRHIESLYDYLYSDDFKDFQIQTTLYKSGTASVGMKTNKNTTKATLKIVASSTTKCTVSGTNAGAYNFNSVAFDKYIKSSTLDQYVQAAVKNIKISKEKHQYVPTSNWWSKSNSSIANTGGWADRSNITNKGCSSTQMTSEFIVGLGDIGSSQTYTLNLSTYGASQTVDSKYLKSAATCTAAAVYYKSCSNCGAALSSTFTNGKALGHTWPGYWSYDSANHWQLCGRAGDAYMYNPEAHTFTSSIIASATCTSAGTHRYTCGCGYYYDAADIPALGHAEYLHDSTGATCTSASTENYYCSRCGAFLRTTHTTPALGHNSPTDYSYETNNNITKGLRYKNCTRCGTRLETAYLVSLTKGTGISSVSGSGYYAANKTITLNVTPSTGYKFKGWSGAFSSSAKTYNFTMPSNAVALTANAELDEFTIIFNDNGGSGGPGSKTINGAGDIPSTKPTRDGYKFMGWGATSSWSAKRFIYSGATTAADGSTATQTSSSWDSSKYASALGLSSISGTITVYAQWEAIPFTINFDDNGGSGGPGSKTINGAGDIPSTKPTRDGYKFMGWGATSSWSPKRFIYSGATTAADGTKATVTGNWTASKYAEVLGIDSIDDSLTVYAQWEAIEYPITYNLNGGTATGNPSSYTIEDPTFTLKNPVKTGYTFTGWTGSNGTTPQTTVSIAKGSTGNKTFTANWKINQYPVTYIDVVDSASGKELGRTTKQINYKTSVRGADLGSTTTDNAYYNGYYYISDTSATVTTSGATVYRVFKQRMITVAGNINWEDWNNKNNSRPDNVILHINGSDGNTYDFTITGNNDKNTSINSWPYSQSVPKYDNNGNIITYTVSQNKAVSREEGLAYKNPVVTEYDILNKITNDAGGDTTFEYIKVAVAIKWIDNNNQYGFRPSEVTLQLLQNGTVISTVSTTEAAYTFTNLQKYDADGDKYEYTIQATNADRYDKAENNSAPYNKTVTYTFQTPTYSVIIPKTVVLDGKTGIGKYAVSVKGNIDDRDFVNVIPDCSFTMRNAYLSDITATVKQDITAFTNRDNIKSEAISTGTITTKSLAGKWSGSFNFNIYFEFGN